MLELRKAKRADLPAINDIYNQAVMTTTATFDTSPLTIQERQRWFRHHAGKYPVLVAEDSGQILAWASLSQYSDRKAYSITAEISLYVSPEARRRGLGRQLTEKIIEEGRLMGLHTLLARIATDNLVSIGLAESFGFQYIGTLKEVGQKFGRLLDVAILQLIYR